MNTKDFEVAILALTAWRADPTGGLDGMLAVACVIRNRVNVWLLSYPRACESVAMFSATTIGQNEDITALPRPACLAFYGSPVSSGRTFDGSTFSTSNSGLLAKIDGVYENTTVDITNGALYWCRPTSVEKGSWMDTEIIGKPEEHKLLAIIGSHQYYA
jgi:hypothetical protein